MLDFDKSKLDVLKVIGIATVVLYLVGATLIRDAYTPEPYIVVAIISIFITITTTKYLYGKAKTDTEAYLDTHNLVNKDTTPAERIRMLLRYNQGNFVGKRLLQAWLHSEVEQATVGEQLVGGYVREEIETDVQLARQHKKKEIIAGRVSTEINEYALTNSKFYEAMQDSGFVTTDAIDHQLQAQAHMIKRETILQAIPLLLQGYAEDMANAGTSEEREAIMKKITDLGKKQEALGGETQ